MTNHLVSTTNEDGNSAIIRTLFDAEHVIASGAKGHFSDQTSCAQFGCAQFGETRHNTTVGGNCKQLNRRNQVSNQYHLNLYIRIKNIKTYFNL